MPPVQPLGRLTRVELRELWDDEARSFTPWLAEEPNLRALGEALGMELELVSIETGVGPYLADILCRDTVDGSPVLIENQLERTDHNHLGQILTYAAGLKAQTVIWIARQFTEQHRAALDWLNEHTTEKVQFFGLEIEAWRIGDSPAAPKYNMVARPNDWSREVPRQATGELTATNALQQEFWLGFREYCAARLDLPFRPTRAHPQHWMDMAIGRTGFHIAAIALLNAIRASFVIQDGPRHFSILQQDREAIERELGFPLTWNHQEGKKMATVFIMRDSSLADRDSWPASFQWIADHLAALYRCFRPRVMGME